MDASEQELVTGGRGRPKDPHRRSAIVAAARSLFLEHGLAPVSMDAIAKAAGVSKRTIYGHFADKDALLHAVIVAEVGDFRPEIPLPSPTNLNELRAVLVDYGVALLDLLTRPGVLDLGRLITAESRRHPALVEQFYAWGPAASHRQLTAIFSDANRRSLLAAVPPEVVADQLTAMWQGLRHLRQQLGLAPCPSRDEIQITVSRAVDVVLRAYAKTDPASAP